MSLSKTRTHHFPTPRFSRDQSTIVWNALCIWEYMIEEHQRWRSLDDVEKESTPKNAMIELWDQIGTNAMRDYAIDLAPWMEDVFRQIEMIIGDDSLNVLNLDPFDWEFVPYVMQFVEWDDEVTSGNSPLPMPMDKCAATIIALRTVAA